MSKIGPKELAARELREHQMKTGAAITASVTAISKKKNGAAVTLPDDGSIPSFLKRTETPEQAAAREKKNRPRDTTGGLKVTEPVTPKPPAIQKALEREFREPKTKGVPITELHKSDNPTAKSNKESWNAIPAVAKAKPKAEAKPPIKVVGPSLPDGPGLARLRASPKAEAIREDVIAKQAKASIIPPKTEQKESVVSKPKKQTAKQPKQNGAAHTPRPGSKLEIIVNAMKSAKGTTQDEMCSKLKWETCSNTFMERTAKRFGFKFRKDEKTGRVYAS